jgi:hypothetical protein
MKPDVYYYTKDKIINVNANFQGKPLFFGPKHSTVLPERKALADLEFKNRDASAVSDEELWEDRIEYADFAKKVLAACRDPQVSYNQQIHSVVPEIALELQSLRREQHSDLEVFWRDWQLGHQHELRQLTGLAGMLHAAVVAPSNFGAGV